MKQSKNSNKISTTEKKPDDYSKIGLHLKLVREQKGLSYEQIFEITRIQPSILKDIEEGKSSISPVFLKGFIKTYARFLGQNFEELFKKVNQEDKQEKDEKVKKVKKNNENNENNENKKRNYSKYIWLLLGLFIVFQVTVWLVNTPNKDREENPILTEDEKTDLKQEPTEDIQPTIQKNIITETQKENSQEADETQKRGLSGRGHNSFSSNQKVCIYTRSSHTIFQTLGNLF